MNYIILQMVVNGSHGGNVSGERNGMYGKHHTEEAKKKISEVHKGSIPWNKGLKNPYSKETLEKMSKIHKSKVGKLSPQYGRKRTEETKQKMRNSKLKLLEHGWKPQNMSGRKHISKDGIKKLVKQEELQKYLDDGYTLGWYN